MAHINNISFIRVSKNEGCTCDRCGQYIQNIWTVKWIEGGYTRFGIDCFEKLCKSGKLTTFGMKTMKKALKDIEYWSDELAKWKNGEYTEENRIDYQQAQKDKYDAFYEVSFEEYRRWWIEKFIPARIADKQKEINKFQKANFTI